MTISYQLNQQLFNKSLGNAIRANRQREDISQETLAERAGVTRRFIQELENGRSNISMQTLYALSQALNTSLTDICTQIETAYHNQ